MFPTNIALETSAKIIEDVNQWFISQGIGLSLGSNLKYKEHA